MGIGDSPTKLPTNRFEVDLQIEEESTRSHHQTQSPVSGEGIFTKERGGL